MVRSWSNSSTDARCAAACSRHEDAEDPWSVHSAGIKDRLPSGKISTQCTRLCRCVCPRTANERPSKG